MWGLCSLLWLDQDYCFITEGGDIRWQSECGLELNFKSTWRAAKGVQAYCRGNRICLMVLKIKGLGSWIETYLFGISVEWTEIKALWGWKHRDQPRDYGSDPSTRCCLTLSAAAAEKDSVERLKKACTDQWWMDREQRKQKWLRDFQKGQQDSRVTPLKENHEK